MKELSILRFTAFLLAAQLSPSIFAAKLQASRAIEFIPPPPASHGGNYSPSVMKDAFDGKTKVWWCAEDPVSLNEVIAYQEISSNGARTAPQIVLKANSVTSGAPAISWEGDRVCDPTVVRGSWTYLGVSYTYAMYYTTEHPGTSQPEGTSNRVGLAFSQNGTTWVKYTNNAVVQGAVANGYYGIGQSVAWNLNGASSVRMMYTDVNAAGVTQHYVRDASDGINFGAPTAISYGGIYVDGVAGVNPYNPAIAVAPGIHDGHYYYFMALVCETHGPGTGFADNLAKGVCVYRTEGDSGLFNGPWIKVLDSAQLRYVEKEPGFATDQWGALLNLPAIGVYMACGDIGTPPGWPANWGLCSSDATMN